MKLTFLTQGRIKRINPCHGDDDPYVSMDNIEFIAGNLETEITIVQGGGHVAAGYARFAEILPALEPLFQ